MILWDFDNSVMGGGGWGALNGWPLNSGLNVLPVIVNCTHDMEKVQCYKVGIGWKRLYKKMLH